MLSYLADEDFNGRIVRGLFLQNESLDLLRVQDVGLLGADDETVLKWAADQDRLVLTHDARTMPSHAANLLKRGLHLPGVFVVDDLAPIGPCIADILLLDACSEPEEWKDQVYYLPLKGTGR